MIGTSVAVLALAAFFGIYKLSSAGTSGTTDAQATYQVASPGPGATAPDFTLPSTSGSTVQLSSYRGKTVMLFFQEGIGCEPCWQQIKDIEAATPRFQKAGIDNVLTITTNDLGQLRQKVADEGLTGPVLADTSFAVSRAYNANQFGMMGTSADGHSFIVVAPNGSIEWRADYGGAPNYTMYVSLDQLLRDFTAGRRPE